MKFYSHKEKELKEHLANVKDIISQNIKTVNFEDVSSEGLQDLLNYSAIFHDLGKYTEYFQDYLLKNKDTGERRHHAEFSAITAYNYLKANNIFDDKLRFLTYYLVKNHHSFLKSFKTFEDFNAKFDNSFQHNHNLQVKDITKNINLINQEFKNFNFQNELSSEHLNPFKAREFFRFIHALRTKNADISNYFLVLYCFSLLIEADKLDASCTDRHEVREIPANIVSKYTETLKISSLNPKRTQARKTISEKIENININKGNIFTLTAPTGIGKTLASMEFALKLKEKIEKNGEKTKIIYCLPFINIIEQTAGEFEKLFKDKDIKVLKHHQFADIAAEDEEKEKNYSFDNALMELECWQGDIIITTFVQFFHTVIGNKNRLLKKFHHLANSIIIFDEAQSIKGELWPLAGVVFKYLSSCLNSQIILMTATRPYIKEATNKFISEKKINTRIQQFIPIVLLDNYQEYYKELNRTRLIPKIKEEGYEIEDFVALFKGMRQGNESALVVVNTIKRSIEVYEALKGCIDNEKLYYLSTNIVPAQRRLLIAQVKKALERGEKLVLVATQCVEAGVDLDFDIGFRDIAPLDSIIQVAGRVNRNNTEGREHSPVYIINFKKDSSNIYGTLTVNACNRLLKDKTEIKESEYLGLIEEYFKNIVENNQTSFDESKKKLKAMEELDFEEVGKFKLIENLAGYVDVFVEVNSDAVKIRKRYEECREVTGKERKQEYNKIKKAVNDYIISVPKKLVASELELLDDKRNLYIIHSGYERENHYEELTGFVRSKAGEATLVF